MKYQMTLAVLLSASSLSWAGETVPKGLTSLVPSGSTQVVYSGLTPEGQSCKITVTNSEAEGFVATASVDSNDVPARFQLTSTERVTSQGDEDSELNVIAVSALYTNGPRDQKYSITVLHSGQIARTITLMHEALKNFDFATIGKITCYVDANPALLSSGCAAPLKGAGTPTL